MRKRIMLISVVVFYGFLISMAYLMYASPLPGNPSKRIMALWVIPGLMTSFFLHFTFLLVSRKIFLESLIISFFIGFVGPLVIHLYVISASNPEAGFLYIGIWWSYGIIFLFSFAISVILKIVKSKKSGKSLQGMEYSRQDFK